jgi:hypothetical protein
VPVVFILKYRFSKRNGDQENKEDLERFGEKALGQEGLERCGCRPMLPGGKKVKKKSIYIICIQISTRFK